MEYNDNRRIMKLLIKMYLSSIEVGKRSTPKFNLDAINCPKTLHSVCILLYSFEVCCLCNKHSF